MVGTISTAGICSVGDTTGSPQNFGVHTGPNERNTGGYCPEPRVPGTAEVLAMAERARTISAPDVRARKGVGDPLVMVTAYDAPSARALDDAGVDVILVGDSVAMVVLGYDDTLQVTTADMAHHVAAVARSKPQALIVGDLPWMSYHVSCEEAVRNAATLIRAGAGAVKLEGGRKRQAVIEAILDAEIPVMGHLGLTPQSIHALGGFRVQGKQLDAAKIIVDDALVLEAAGCFAIVLECVPDAVARMVTDAVSVPTIGIGAGRHCDGQVLVFHDLLGVEDRSLPKFVRRYANVREVATEGLRLFAADVRAGRFPSSEETYHMTDQMAEALGLYGASAGTAGAIDEPINPIEPVTPVQ